LPEVKLVNITKKYGKIMANDHVSITINNGEYVSVIGPSGCGKTTLIKIIAGIIKPDEGEVYIGGKLVSNLPIEERKIGYVFQNIALFPHLTTLENIIYGPKVRSVSLEQMRLLVLETMDLIKVTARSDAYPSELSSGMQQKIAVARAMISSAELLLLDEPLGALDVKVRAEMRHELRRLVKDMKLTAFHVTHDQEEAMSISDRVIVMKLGRIVEAGAPFELYTHPKNIFTANFVGEANFLVGTVIQRSDEGSLVDLRKGLQVMTNIREVSIGDKVVVAFRPEFVSFGNEGINRLSGTVEDLIYSGKTCRFKVKLTNGETITIKAVTSFGEPICKIADNVTVNILPEDILVYPYPKGGLDKELALE
jgi:ABC-type Fe3+/spermidine/putrescine transport system ATPase subunit